MSHAQHILSVARAMPEGALLLPKQFLHLGSRAAIDKTFSRLCQEGQLMRVHRGIYVAPYHGRFGVRAPSAASVVQALESWGETIVPTGAAEANGLALTTQVPIREVFVTSGPSRSLQLGRLAVEFRHGKRWQWLLGKRPAGRVIRALAWLGPEFAPQALTKLRSGATLPESEWEAIIGVRAILPNWLAKMIGEEMVA